MAHYIMLIMNDEIRWLTQQPGMARWGTAPGSVILHGQKVPVDRPPAPQPVAPQRCAHLPPRLPVVLHAAKPQKLAALLSLYCPNIRPLIHPNPKS